MEEEIKMVLKEKFEETGAELSIGFTCTFEGLENMQEYVKSGLADEKKANDDIKAIYQEMVDKLLSELSI